MEKHCVCVLYICVCAELRNICIYRHITQNSFLVYVNIIWSRGVMVTCNIWWCEYIYKRRKARSFSLIRFISSPSFFFYHIFPNLTINVCNVISRGIFFKKKEFLKVRTLLFPQRHDQRYKKSKAQIVTYNQ